MVSAREQDGPPVAGAPASSAGPARAPADGTSQPVRAVIGEDGLRYRSKPAGTPFDMQGRYQPTLMSCFLCGRHRPRSLLKTRRLVGRAQSVCDPSCAELGARLEGPG